MDLVELVSLPFFCSFLETKNLMVLQTCSSKLFKAIEPFYQTRYKFIKPAFWPETFPESTKYKKACHKIALNQDRLSGKVIREPFLEPISRDPTKPTRILKDLSFGGARHQEWVETEISNIGSLLLAELGDILIHSPEKVTTQYRLCGFGQLTKYEPKQSEGKKTTYFPLSFGNAFPQGWK
jgi:prolyl oligopeptidase PreP (S9A serine peptidase family)